MVNTEIMLEKNGILKLDETLEKVSPCYNPDATIRPSMKKISSQLLEGPRLESGSSNFQSRGFPTPQLPPKQRYEKGPISKKS